MPTKHSITKGLHCIQRSSHPSGISSRKEINRFQDLLCVMYDELFSPSHVYYSILRLSWQVWCLLFINHVNLGFRKLSANMCLHRSFTSLNKSKEYMGSTLEMSSLLHISSYIPYHANPKYIPVSEVRTICLWKRGVHTLYIENTRWVSFDIKFTRQGFENACWHREARRAIQHAFSKPSLVNLISKDTNLVFHLSVYPLFHS